MKIEIEKDAEWLRLEGKVGQLRGSLIDAEKKLEAYAAESAAKQLGVTLGTTIVECGGAEFVASSVERSDWGWLKGRKIRKDGKPADREQNLYDKWKTVTD